MGKKHKMTELKTLKDLKKCPQCERGGEEYKCIQNYELKQEAIKDIKAIQDFEKSQADKLWEALTGNKIIYSEEAKQGIMNYIKWKFNITEEDLK